MKRDQLSGISKWEYGKILEEEDQPCCATRNYFRNGAYVLSYNTCRINEAGGKGYKPTPPECPRIFNQSHSCLWLKLFRKHIYSFKNSQFSFRNSTT